MRCPLQYRSEQLLLVAVSVALGGCQFILGIDEPFLVPDDDIFEPLPDLVGESLTRRGDEIVLNYCNDGVSSSNPVEVEIALSSTSPGATIATRFVDLPAADQCAETIVPCSELSIDCRLAHELGAALDVAEAVDEVSEANNLIAVSVGGIIRAFVTRDPAFSAELGGAIEADFVCQSTADREGLGGQWTAWLSDDFIDVGLRLQAPGAVVERVDGALVIDNIDNLPGATLVNPIDHDETGLAVPPATCVYTGTLPDRTSTGFHCDNWGNPSATVTLGIADEVGLAWTASAESSCDVSCSIYCFEESQPVAAGPTSDLFISEVIQSLTNYEISLCNGGDTVSGGPGVSIHVQDSISVLALLTNPVAIPDASTCVTVSFPCDALGDLDCFGDTHLLAAVDPLDEIIELDKTNNVFVQDFFGGQ